MNHRVIAALGAAWGMCACSSPAPSPSETGASSPAAEHVQALAERLASAASGDAGPGYEWPAPSGWYVDGFALPPPFAPTLAYVGSEQTEQAPGFADPSLPDFWSYTFLWWIEGDAPVRRDALERNLVAYYSGLSGDCVDPGFPCDPHRFAAHLTPAFGVEGRGPQIFLGDVATYDPFFTGEPLTLNLVVSTFVCPRSEHRALLVSASPQPFSSAVWKDLVARQLAFRCRA